MSGIRAYMNKLNIDKKVIDDFLTSGLIHVSSSNFDGWEEANEEQLKRVSIVESLCEGKVICINEIYSKSRDVTLESHIMYVEGDSEENLEYGFVYAYVFNLDSPSFSELGSISVESVNGVLMRKLFERQVLSW